MLNKKGQYLAIPASPADYISNFCGWFNIIETGNSESMTKNIGEGGGYTFYKTIENIYINKPVLEVINNYVNVERIYNDSTEKFTISKDGLIYDVNSYNDYINIELDFRQIFDTDDKGRLYDIYKQDDLIIVDYKKFSDNACTEMISRYYLVIKGATSYERVDKWSQKFYKYDIARKNNSGLYIYDGLKIPCRNNITLYFAFSDDKEQAIQKVDGLAVGRNKIDDGYTDYIENILSVKNNIYAIAGRDAAFAYAGCITALDSLSMQLSLNNKRISGMWAGLPWFFQYWSRDELISVRAPLLEHHYEYGKEVLMKYLSEIMSDGRLSNRYPTANLGSADSIGWLFKRLQDFLFLCEQRDTLHSYFSLYDLTYIRERLKFSIQEILKTHSKDGLILNSAQETWIDTFNNDGDEKDYRAGARIEIQALFLSMLKFMNMLDTYLGNKFVKKNNKLVRVISEEFNTQKLEEEMRTIVKEKFLANIDGKLYLNDGHNSALGNVIRPNIFIAYYVYPELLSTKEWIQVFDNALPKIWCEWDFSDGIIGGGLSTIDKTHPLYQPYYTGIDNRSYHRGDSWFWVNNIAAISMYRLDKEYYKDYILKILNASSQDILYSGFIGYASELASSGWFKSGGCLCQTWSIATFIELMHEVYIN